MHWIEYAIVICFTAVAFKIAPAHPTESIIYHFLLFVWRINGYWSVNWVHVIRWTNLPLNCHTRACSKHVVNAEGRRLYPDELPSLTLASNYRRLGYNWRKPPRYWSASASLGNETVTIVIPMVWLSVGPPALPLRSLHGLSPTSHFLLRRNPPALRPKSPGEVGTLGETILGTSEKAQVDRRFLHERNVVTTIVTGSLPRLANRYLAGFLLLLLQLIHVNGSGTNICPLRWQNVCYRFVGDDSVGGLFT